MKKWKIYRKLEPGEFIVCGVDTAAGGGDFCAGQFISKTKRDVPIVYHAHEIATDMTPEIHYIMETIYGITGVKPVVAYERNAGGVFEIERLARMNRSGHYDIYHTKEQRGTVKGAVPTIKLGWDTNSASRPAMLADLKDAIDHHLLKLYDRPTLGELFSFVVVQTTSSWKAQAENGMHDDLIMSLAIAWQLFQTESSAAVHMDIVRPKPADSGLKAPIATAPDELYDPQVMQMVERSMKDAMRHGGKDWLHK
jgi:hypothetical protein